MITIATRVCNLHFQQSGIVRVPGGSRLRLKIGTLPPQMESEARWRTEKKESSEKPKSTM